MTMAVKPSNPLAIPNGNQPINTISAACPFDISIQVSAAVFTPLELEEFDHDGWDKWRNEDKIKTPFIPSLGQKGDEKVTFTVNITQNDIDSLFIEIVDFDPKKSPNGKVLHKFNVQAGKDGMLDSTSQGANFSMGQWKLEWDGYINDIFDTRLFKNENIRIRAIGSKTCSLTGSSSSGVKEAYASFNGQVFQSCAEPADWVDVVVNRANKTVDVEWRMEFDDGGVSGKVVQNTPSYQDLQNMAVIGVQQHWSRAINTISGIYQVNIVPVISDINATPSMTLEVQMKASEKRSVNSSCACGVGLYRGVGEIFSDTTRTWHLLGYFNNNRSNADSDFKATVAHEMGHAVLASYAYKDRGPNNYSWVHKGSSNGITSGYSTPKLGEKGYETKPNPLPSQIDLMKYYSFYVPPSHQKASEYDVKMLIWLSNLNIGGGV